MSSIIKYFVDDLFSRNDVHPKREDRVKLNRSDSGSPSSNDLAEFVFYSERKPRYRAGTKLRRNLYRKLKENGFIVSEHIREIVEDFVKTLDKKNTRDIYRFHMHQAFICKCGWLLYNPATLACGHTFCKHCADENKFCLECGHTFTNPCSVSVLLVEVISNWYQTEYEGAKYKKEARDYFVSKQYTKSLESINKSIKLVPEDYSSLNIRAEVYLNLKYYKEALHDAELSCKINDSCAKTHFIIGMCHASLKDLDQAIDEFQQCLELDPDDVILSNAVIASIDKILAPDFSEEDDIDNKWKELDSSDSSEDDLSKSGESNNGRLNCEIAEGSKGEYKNIIKTDTLVLDETSDSIGSCVGSIDSDSCVTPSGNVDSSSLEPVKKFKGVPTDLIKEDDFECKLCYELLFRPVTISCGHVFCKNCLVRTLDHNAVCPICRLSLTEYLRDPTKPVTVIIENLLKLFFKEQFMAREKEYTEKMEKLSRVGIDEDVDVPIFVCSIAFPYVQCPLHIFEPKYRLMVRECLESGGRKFGMCIPQTGDEYSDIGTICEITRFQTLADGRYIIHTTAGQRFVCKNKAIIDSLNYAKVSYFQDEHEDLDQEQLIDTSRRIYNNVSAYINSLKTAEQDCIFNALGMMPAFEEDFQRFRHGVPWVWWGLAALPLNLTAKLVLLRSKCVSERMKSLQRFLKFLTKIHTPVDGNTADSESPSSLNDL